MVGHGVAVTAPSGSDARHVAPATIGLEAQTVPVNALAGGVARGDARVLSAGGHTWTRGDVVAALAADPAADAARHRLERELAARSMLTAELPGDAVRAVIDGLRRERHLLSRDDTERWLSDHDLATADLVQWGEAVVARRSLSLDEIDARLEQEPIDPAEVTARWWAFVVLSGQYHRGVDTLALGAAAWATGLAAAPIGGPRPGPHTLDLARRRFLRTAGEDESALAALVARQQFEWIVVEGTRLVFTTADAAAEGANSLCDGRPLDEICAYAARAGEASVDIGSLDGPAQAAFAGAGAGAVLGPVSTGLGAGTVDDLEVWVITGRREPSLTDPATRRRAAAEHAERSLQAAVTRQVQWHVDA